MKIHFFTAPFYFAFIWFRVLVAASPPQKEANPASLRSAAPSEGRGSRGHSLLPMEGGAPKGRRLDGESGMKESGKDRLKCAVNESTRAPLRGLPSPMGKAKRRGASLSQKEANPASLRSAAPSKGRGSRGYSLLPMEGGAPKGRRLDGGSGMKKIEGRSSQVRHLRECRYPRHKAFPAWGRWRAERAG